MPFTGGTLDRRFSTLAIRLAQAEDATLVPAYLLLVPLATQTPLILLAAAVAKLFLYDLVELNLMARAVAFIAVGLLLLAGGIVYQRLWDEEHFDRILTPAPNGRGGGFTSKDVTWILAHAPAETIVLKPSPNGAQQAA